MPTPTESPPAPTPTLTVPVLTDPYASSIEPRRKLSCSVPDSVYIRLKSIWCYQGAVQLTVSILIDKLINELDKRKITSHIDADQYAEFLKECRLVGPRK